METNPAYARAWLESLSPVDNAESARDLYHGLYTLNRTDLDFGPRHELMQLFHNPVREAINSFQTVFNRGALPVAGKPRQLAEFLGQLDIEMAHGYKLCVQGVLHQWLPWRRRLLAPMIGRALFYLGEVLLRSYQLYRPHPVGVWRDVHALYRFAENHGRHEEQVDAYEGTEIVSLTVSQRYRRLLMLGAANPYQMPFNECATVYRFLRQWIGQVSLQTWAPADTSGCFSVDVNVDAPPAPLGRAQPLFPKGEQRLIVNAGELARTLHGFLRRLERGDAAAELRLGVDCLDSACHDMLQRLHRAYAQTVSRRHARIKRHETVMVCAGIGAVHFFTSGQKPLLTPEPTVTEDVLPDADKTPVAPALEENEAYVALDEPAPARVTAPSSTAPDNFQVDRWRVCDVSPQGLLLAQDRNPEVKFRVGDVIGIQRTSVPGQWSVGVVRWCRTQRERGIEVGVELIAPDAKPASVKSVVDAETSIPTPALMLPAVEVAHRPASVLVTRGVLQVGKDFFLTNAERNTRRVRVLDALARTGSMEQVIVGNVIE